MLIPIAATLLAAIAVQAIAQRLRLPTISGLLLLGIAVGPSGFDLLPIEREAWFLVTSDVALAMIGFVLGTDFTPAHLRGRGIRGLRLSLGLAIGTALVVGVTLASLGVPPELALLLAGIAPATDPAATVAVLDELGVEDNLTRDLRAIVALDDVWGVLIFALCATGAAALGPSGADLWLLGEAFVEIAGSILLGATLGAIAAPFTARINPGKTTLLEALGLVLLLAGITRALGFSPILASVAMGAALGNLARHHERPVSEIEHVSWPFLVVFFVLAGASFDLETLGLSWVIALIYIVARLAGRFVGIGAGAWPAGERDAATLAWTPLALLPQAGVALGLALSTVERFPGVADTVISVTIAGTLVFELIGPPIGRLAITRARRGLPKETP